MTDDDALTVFVLIRQADVGDAEVLAVHRDWQRAAAARNAQDREDEDAYYVTWIEEVTLV